MEERILRLTRSLVKVERFPVQAPLALGNLSALTKDLVNLRMCFSKAPHGGPQTVHTFDFYKASICFSGENSKKNVLGTSIYVLVPVLK